MTYELKKIQEFLDQMDDYETVFVEDFLGCSGDNYVLIETHEDDFEILMELEPYEFEGEFSQKEFLKAHSDKEVLFDMRIPIREQIIYLVVKNHTDECPHKIYGDYHYYGSILNNQDPNK